MKSHSSWMLVGVWTVGLVSGTWSSEALAHGRRGPDVRALRALGKEVFFDTALSNPQTQSCASCHVASAGFASGDSDVNAGPVVVPGAEPTTHGGRRPPTAAYATFAPKFDANDVGCMLPEELSEDEDPGFVIGALCVGGLFWDGRATGETIGVEVFAHDKARLTEQYQAAYEDFLGPAADQALGPFANPVEQALPVGNTQLPGAEAVCQGVADSSYAGLYARAWGVALDCSVTGADLSFKRIAVAISAWEHSREVNQFSSRRDFALAWDSDGAFPLEFLSAEENLGHDLFFGKANCSACHQSVPQGDELTGLGDEPRQLYTDFAFPQSGTAREPRDLEVSTSRTQTSVWHTSPDVPNKSVHSRPRRCAI